nr:mechanosensitive ion channel family protein [Nitrosomonas nitrosa]
MGATFGDAAAQTGESATQAMGVWSRLAAALGEKSAKIATALQDLPELADRLGSQLSGGRGALGLITALVLIALVYGGAHVVERFASRRWRRWSEALLAMSLQGLGQRLSALAITGLLDLIEAALFAGIAAIALSAAFSPSSLQHKLALSVGLTILAARIGAIPLRLALSPDSADVRLLHPRYSEPKRLFAQCYIALILMAAAYFGSGFLAIASLPPIFVNIWFMTLGIAVTAWIIRIVWRQQTELTSGVPAGALVGDSAMPAAEQIRLLIARNRRWLLVGLLIGAWILWAANLLLDHRESALAVLLSALIILLFPAFDRCCRTAIGWAAISDDSQLATNADAAGWPFRFRVLLFLLRLMLVIAAAILALEAWGLRVFELLATPAGQKTLHALLTLAIAAPVAMVIWHGSQALLERKLGQLPAPGDETPGTRAHTLVPILRTFFMVFLFVLVAMMVLVSVGVEIGPLIAGAGIFGVAVGFGSQSLVRDVISGFFFLLDDAFRLGEYIDVGKCKGTVERISIRSLQLRHHRGALNTIPYGQIQSISNYTRDWVIEKLEFGLVFGTDPEKVRKLVKKIGQELLANPELAPDILDPLKSQGVQRFADSAIVFRAKVKCRPGRQFTVRREAYRRMQEVFAANGIEFAYPTLNVRGDNEDASLSPVAAERP